jgi:hypothetical protein
MTRMLGFLSAAGALATRAVVRRAAAHAVGLEGRFMWWRDFAGWARAGGWSKRARKASETYVQRGEAVEVAMAARRGDSSRGLRRQAQGWVPWRDGFR